MNFYELYLFDLDGTLYRGEQPIDGATITLNRLRELGAKIRFLTNNSSNLPQDVSAKLNSLGIEANPSEVYTSAMAAANLCRSHGFTSAFVVGEAGLTQTLRSAGIDTEGQTADVVVVGICRSLTYRLIDEALQHLRAGAHLMATNKDATYPLERGRIAPGAGSIVAAIETCSGLAAEVAGKPEPTLARLAITESGVTPGGTLLVGDRVDTDIECARRAGIDSLLVLSGVSEPTTGVRTAKSLCELLRDLSC